MKKLKLDLDALAVDTFDPQPLDEQQGTVLGEQWGQTQIACGPACLTNLRTCLTRHLSCLGTCAVSCNRTCATCRVTCGIYTCITCDSCRATCYTCLTCPTGCVDTRCGPYCMTVQTCP